MFNRSRPAPRTPHLPRWTLRLTLTLTLALPLTVAVVGSSCTSAPTDPTSAGRPCESTECVYWSSFEDGLDRWVPRAADAGPWRVERTKARARDGIWSVELYADNSTDATKVWLQRGFKAKPLTPYVVTTEFALCCIDYSPSSPNYFAVIADARAAPPDAAVPGLVTFPAAAGDDSSAVAVGSAFWRHKRFSATVTTGSSGDIIVGVGVWLIFEVPFTFNLDNVKISLREASSVN